VKWWLVAGGSGAVAILIDQGSKSLASATVINSGISFGLGQSLGINSNTLLTFFLPVVIIIIFCLFRTFWLKYPFVAGFFTGAAASNWIDRVVYGGVRDWLPVPFFHLQNNLADWIITVTLGGVLLLHIYDKHRSSL
jgi:lipoprotein signal peptidase